MTQDLYRVTCDACGKQRTFLMRDPRQSVPLDGWFSYIIERHSSLSRPCVERVTRLIHLCETCSAAIEAHWENDAKTENEEIEF